MTDLRDKFRPSASVKDINQAGNRDPAYEYKNVIHTYKHDPNRIVRYLDMGWEYVEDTETLVDDRDFAPNSKAKKLRPQLITSKTTDKHEQVLMRILRTKRAENQENAKKARENSQQREAVRNGDTVVQEGNNVTITGKELNF